MTIIIIVIIINIIISSIHVIIIIIIIIIIVIMIMSPPGAEAVQLRDASQDAAAQALEQLGVVALLLRRALAKSIIANLSIPIITDNP